MTAQANWTGRSIIWNRVKGNGTEPLNLGWGQGTGVGLTDVNLFSPVADSRATGTSSLVTTGALADTYKVVGTLTATAPRAITELALFDTASALSPTTTVTGSLTVGATGNQAVGSTSGWPATGNFYTQIDHEVVVASVVDGATLNLISRGALGSTAATHGAAAVASLGGDGGAGGAGATSSQTATVGSAQGGSMFAHADFAAINLQANDSVTFTWQTSLLSSVPAWSFSKSSVDIDFVNNRAQVYGVPATPISLLSVSRASTKVAIFADAHWAAFASNILAITDVGANIEESATNGIRNPRAEGGTSSVSPTNWTTANASSLTITPVGVSQINGIDGMAYDISGTASATTTLVFTFEAASTIVAANPDLWTLSPFIAILSGSTTGLSKIANRANWTGAGTNTDGVDIKGLLTATPQRFADTFTAPASTTFLIPRLQITPINGGVVSLRLWIGWTQAVKAAYATSPVLPPAGTPASATRTADVVSLTGGASLAALSAQAALCITGGAIVGTNPRLFDINAVEKAFFSTTTALDLNNGTTDAIATFGSGTTAGLVKSAFGFDATSFTAVANNGVKVTTAGSWGGPTSPVYIGNRGAGDRALNGPMQRITFGPTKGQFDGNTI